MTEPVLPAQNYAQAVPYLRAPYTPSLIRFRIQSVPDQPDRPCVVVLFVSSEAVMDRLNIVCGEHWTTPSFEVLVHREQGSRDGRPVHYVKVRATFGVFGRSFSDTGEASDRSEAQSEFSARAQAFKRAARWPGPGQSLYQPSAITMFRGEADDRLRTYGDSKPYIDERSEGFLRAHYEKVLREKIVPIYGEPFDHLRALSAVRPAMDSGLAQAVKTRIRPDPPTKPTSHDAAPNLDFGQESATSSPDPSSDVAPSAVAGRQLLATLTDTAQASGYDAALIDAVSELACGDGSGPSSAQVECARGWIARCAQLELSQHTVQRAIQFALANCSSRAGAQAKFTQWLAGKARQAGSRLTPEARPDPDEQQDRSLALDAEVDAVSAMSELRAAIARHDYSERSAARLAALASGADPDGRIEWSTISAATVRCVAELLDAAATLQWTSQSLDDEISRAHNNTQHGTSASRFGALAVHLVNSAEARDEELELAAADALSALAALGGQ